MKRLIVIPFILIALSLFATPIGEKRAKEIALNFFASGSTRSFSVELNLEWAGSDVDDVDVNSGSTRSSDSETDGVDDALIYIYNRVDKRSFVVVAGDDNVERAIVAFSHSNIFDTKNMPDGARDILKAWCEQIAAARDSKGPKVVSTRAETGVGNVVCQYGTALWGQDKPFCNNSPVFNGMETRIGCAATAIAIWIYYHKWPTKGFGTTPAYTYRPAMDVSVGKQTIPENKLGRSYEYDNMLSDYSNGYSQAQANAVAALFYDIGTAIQSQFSTKNTTPLNNILRALTTHFGYSKNAIQYRGESFTHNEWVKMLQNNISKCGPTLFSGNTSSGGGHAFILDGYTDAGYFSVNYGWNGSSNGYYLLPENGYAMNQRAKFDLIPDKDGSSTYSDYLTLRYVVDSSSGQTLRGLYTEADKYEIGKSFVNWMSICNSGAYDFYGYICIAHCDKEDNIKEILWQVDRTKNKLGFSIDFYSLPTVRYKVSTTITKSVDNGDRLRVFYRSSKEEDWILARRYDTQSYDKVLLCATPQEVAQSLNLEYDKENKSLSFLSEHAIQYIVKDASGAVVISNNVTSHTTELIDLSTLKAGTYTCSFASGGEPYELKLKL